jgi:hypothetical protein
MAKPSACILGNEEKTCENGYSGFLMETAYWKIAKPVGICACCCKNFPILGNYVVIHLEKINFCVDCHLWQI